MQTVPHLLGGIKTASLLVLTGFAPLAVAGGEGRTPSCPGPVNYCSTSPNSAGPGAVISWTGMPDPTADNFHLVSTGCPANQFLLYYYGGVQLANPFGNGWRCVGNGGLGLYRFNPAILTDSAGVAVMKVDFTQPPAGGGTGQWSPGNTWYCQAWYRDPTGGGAQFNLTDGLEVPICLDGTYDEMILVPEGTFEMGDHSGTGDPDELPIHTVDLDEFYMDISEVTNQQYADYLNTANFQGRITVSGNVVHQLDGAGEALCDTELSAGSSRITWDGSTFGVVVGKEEHPMVMVSWFGACTYANQRSRDFGLTPSYDETTWTCDFAAGGFRLPTEAEWEYGARGGEHSPYFMYPWGSTIDGSKANYVNSGDPFQTGPYPWTTPARYYDGNQVPAGVDMANGYGLYDMAGNVWEWCGDWYSAGYYSTSPTSNPTGPTIGWRRVIRDGCWTNFPVYLRSANRSVYDMTLRSGYLGFRIVGARR